MAVETTTVQSNIIAQLATGRRIEDAAPMFMVSADEPEMVHVHTKSRGTVRNSVITYDRAHDTYSVAVHTFRSGNVAGLVSKDYDLVYADQMVGLVLGQAA